MCESFLVMHHSIIHREPEQNGSEAHADDIDVAVDQPAERERARKNEAQQCQQPKHRFHPPMSEPK